MPKFSEIYIPSVNISIRIICHLSGDRLPLQVKVLRVMRMILKHKTLKAILMFAILFLSPILVFTPVFPNSATASEQLSSNEVNSDLSPLGAQYRTGDWRINSTETYIDDELILTGNLIVESGGVLTLENTTLRMNCTSTANQFWIIVESGGRLNVWDSDNNPTTADGSLITDSTFDQDEGNFLDYRYFFRVEAGGKLDINNSAVEECGNYDQDMDLNTYGLYIEGNNAVIKNSTFNICGCGIILNGSDHSLIEFVNLSYIGHWSIYVINSNNTKIQYCWLNLPQINERGVYLVDNHNMTFQNNSIKTIYECLFVKYVEFSNFIDNNLKSNDNTIHCTELTNSHNITFDRVLIEGGGEFGSAPTIIRYGVHLTSCENITFRKVNVSNRWGINIEESKNITISNSEFYGLSHDGIRLYGRDARIEDINITNCNFINLNGKQLNAIYGQNINRFRIVNCTVQNLKGTVSSAFGLRLMAASNGLISKCKLLNIPDWAMLFSECYNLIITHNNIGGPSYASYGVRISRGGENYFAHNTINPHPYTHLSIISSTTNNLIFNNTINGPGLISGSGIYIQSADSNLILNNTITDCQRGIEDYSYNTIKNTTISSCSDGLYVKYSSIDNVSCSASNNAIYIPSNGKVIAKNSSFLGITNDVHVTSNSELSLVNCSFNPFKLAVDPNGRLYIKWWVDVYINDTNGSVPGATVRVLNVTDALDIEGLTGDSGHIILPVTERMFYNGWVDMNPLNISAILLPDIAYLAPEPTITSNSKFTITFKTDTHPTPPRNLMATSSRDNVQLTWEYPPLGDLNHFEIFKSSYPVNFNFSSPIGITSAVSRSWIDIGGAQNWTTYYYCLKAVDNAAQSSTNPSNTARCGDWGVVNSIKFSNLNIVLNGSLKIWDGGEYGIWIREGGVLEISDTDDNPMTTIDASNISASNTSNSIYMIVEPGGKLYMNNSIAFGIGYNNPSIYNHTGIYIGGDNSILSGNIIKATDKTQKGLIIKSANGVKIINNKFEILNLHPIEMKYASNCHIENNTMDGGDVFGIYMENTISNTIKNNTINYCVLGIGLVFGENDKLIDNILKDNFGAGIIFTYSNNIRIQNNTIKNHTRSPPANGINISFSEGCTIIGNNITNNEYGIQIILSSDITISSNQITDHATTGVYLAGCIDIRLENNTISDSVYDGVFLTNFLIKDKHQNCKDITFISGNISDCLYGLYFSCAEDVYLEDVDIWSNSAGLNIDNSRNIVINRSKIEANTNYGIFIRHKSIFDPYSLWLENTTFSNPGATNLGLDEEALIVAINISLPYNTIQFNDAISKVAFFWYVNIYVEDMFGLPCNDTEVSVRQIDGGTIVKFTDDNGLISWLQLHDKTVLLEGNFTSNPYTISAFQGNHHGENITDIEGPTTIRISLDNQAPTVIEIGLAPHSPSTLYDLQLSFNYFDPEGDPEYPYTIKWFVDGVEKPNLANKTLINSSKTIKNQNWFARVWVFDGARYSEPVDSNLVTIKNSLPVVTSVRIEETSPRSSDDLHVNYSFSDNDNDSEINSLHRWYVDRGEGWEYSGQDTLALSSINTKKGEIWRCEVTPGDGEGFGEAVSTETVTILNTPPSVSNLKIYPEKPKSNETLTVDYDYFDLDSDEESDSMIIWYRNDEVQPELNGSVSVSPLITKKGEVWYYEIIPSDGEDFGAQQTSVEVIIENTAPTVSELIIGPENPTTADDLVVGYDFDDMDNDEESFDTIIEWLRKRPGDIEFSHTGLRVKTLSSVYTTKNEVWTCEVTPHDGYNFGETVRCNISITIRNSKPTVTNVRITPDKLLTTTDLNADYEYSDLDKDIESGTEIMWYQNDIVIPELKNKFTISHNLTKKDEVWYFTLRPRDGQDLGDLVTSDKITIQNSPPSATNLTITPSYPSSDDNLEASYNYSDYDYDPESTPVIRWYQNGLRRAELDDKLIADSEYTEKGDIWYFTLSVSDGFDFSETTTSHYITIGNTIATITSITPPLGKIILNETDSEHFSIEAIDPDGDFLVFKWRLNDETVSSNDYFDFKTDYEPSRDYYSSGYYYLNLTIQDVGKKPTSLSFVWEITVLNVNRKPELTIIKPKVKDSRINEGDYLEFEIHESDPDTDDTLVISWYLDENEVQSTGRTYTYVSTSLTVGEHVVKVEVTDGKASVSYSWNLTVIAVEEKVEGMFGLNWDQLGLLVEAIVVIFTAIFAAIGIIKLRKKRSKLKEYMDEIDEVMDKDELAKDKEKELIDLKRLIKDEFSRGLITENHYMILEREVDDALGETRKAILEERVVMPEALKEDVSEVLKDGMVTKEEYQAIMQKIRMTKELSQSEKLKLNMLMSQWMRESKGSSPSRGMDEKFRKPRRHIEKPVRKEPDLTNHALDEPETDDAKIDESDALDNEDT